MRFTRGFILIHQSVELYPNCSFLRKLDLRLHGKQAKAHPTYKFGVAQKLISKLVTSETKFAINSCQ